MASIKITTADADATSNIFMKCKTTFQVVTTTLLSLLLPLSFLLLARLSLSISTAHDHVSFEYSHFPPTPSLVFFSFLLNSIPFSPLHLLVSLLCIASLVHTLNNTSFPTRPTLYTAWILLCTFQVSVGLGIEGSISAGIDASGQGRNFMCRNIMFFFGLYGTTVYWSRMIVKQVVDDTMFGCTEMEERLVDRVVLGVTLGGLWWWRLRDEVEALVVVMEMKREMEVRVVDFMGWWLYYLVVTIGIVRLLKGLIWFGVILLCKKVEVEVRDDNDSNLRVEEKV